MPCRYMRVCISVLAVHAISAYVRVMGYSAFVQIASARSPVSSVGDSPNFLRII